MGKKAKSYVVSSLIALLVVVLLSTGVSAEQLNMTVEVKDVVAKYNTPTLINVTISQYGYSEGLLGFEMDITFNSSLMKVNDVTINFAGITDWNFVGTNKIKLTGASQVGVPVSSGYVLATINATALRNDGSWDFVNISYNDFTVDTTPATSGSAKLVINGTFTTLDEVPPRVTFNKANYSTVGPELNVVATLYDLSGIDVNSVKVYIDNVELQSGQYSISQVDPATWNVGISVNVSELLGVRLPHDVEIKVVASDTKGNTATGILIVTAANIGFFEPRPSDGSFLNTSDVAISVKYSQIDPDTIRMFVDGVNVTASLGKLTGIVVYNATNLGEGVHKVNVTGVGVNNEVYWYNWSFIVDLTSPTITSFTVSDSDGDGFIEVREDITLIWNATDNVQLDKLDVFYNNQTIKTVQLLGSSSTDSVTLNLNGYGGELKIVIYDKAGNKAESNVVHVYNNYIAYVVLSQPKTVFGLNVTKIAALDVLDPNVVSYTLTGASGFTIPLEKATRILIPGSKANVSVYVDRNANKTLNAFPSSALVLDGESKLDFSIKAPAEGVILVFKINDSKAKEMGVDLLKNRSLGSISLDELPDLMDYAYIFDSVGWAKVLYDTQNKQFKPGDASYNFAFSATTIEKLLEQYSVNIANGFTTNYQEKPVLEAGYYALIVFSKDGDVIALDLVTPFVVLNGTKEINEPTVTAKVIAGDKVRVEFDKTFNAASALMIKNVKYSLDVKVSLTEKLFEMANVTLSYGDKKLRELRPLNKSTNIWIPEGMIKAALTLKDLNYLEVDTSGLEPGEYLLYIVALDNNYQATYVGEFKVTVIEDTVPPTLKLEITSINNSVAKIKYEVSDKNGLSSLTVNVTYPNGSTVALLSKSYDGKEYDASELAVLLTLNGTYNVYAVAYDIAGNYAEYTLKFVRPEKVAPNETEKVVETGDLEIVIEAGTQGAEISVQMVVTKENETIGVESLEEIAYVPVKYLEVEPIPVNGTIKKYTLIVKYTEDEIKGLDEDKLKLFYWNGTAWLEVKVGKLDATHYVYTFTHDKFNNKFVVEMSNLSVFALGGKPRAVTKAVPLPYVPVGVGGGYAVIPAPLVAKAIVEYSTFTYFVANTLKTMEIPAEKAEETGIVSLTVKLDFTGNVYVTVAKVELPTSIPAPTYDVYNFVEIVFYTTEKEVSPSGKVEFKVSKDWMKEKGYSPEQVVLMKYDSGWKELPTSYVREDENYYYFESSLESFSLFAIAVKPAVKPTPTPVKTPIVTPVPVKPTPTPTPTPTPKPPEKMPGWILFVLAVVVVVIVIAAAYKLRKK